MKRTKSFLDRFIERAEDVDANSRQAYILRLARDRGFFETVFDAIEEGVLVVDRRLRIRYFNKAAETMLGLPANTASLRLSQFLQDVDWRRIISKDENEWVRVSRQEVEILYPSSRFIQFYLVPLEEDPTMAAVILRDVTESRSHTMKELEQETTSAVSMLAAAVAHEIGNPLNSLYLNLQLIDRSLKSPSPQLSDDEVREMIESCKNEVERLDKIISQFLGAVRPGEPVLQPVDIRELIVETLNFMRREIESRNIELKCEWPGELPKISGDPGLLRQAFYNILKNALQATPSGGSINIGCRYDDDVLVLEFIDSGRGIDARELSQIFTPFKSFRPDGNGLGMMIIQRICREHGAELNIDSEPGTGTVVTVKFRRRPRQMRVLS